MQYGEHTISDKTFRFGIYAGIVFFILIGVGIGVAIMFAAPSKIKRNCIVYFYPNKNSLVFMENACYDKGLGKLALDAGLAFPEETIAYSLRNLRDFIEQFTKQELNNGTVYMAHHPDFQTAALSDEEIVKRMKVFLTTYKYIEPEFEKRIRETVEEKNVFGK